MSNHPILSISENKKMIFCLGFLLLSACGPSNFQVNNQNLPSTSSDASSNTSDAPSSEPTVIQSTTKTCSLNSNNQIKIGEKVKFEFSSNFEIPKESKIIWKGQSYDVNFTESKDADLWLNRGLEYSNSFQAGIHKRQVIVNDSNGNLICQSNVLKIEFIGDISADKSCAITGGHLTGEDNELCVVEAWTLYRFMLERNLVNIPSQTGSNLGLADPSSVNCNTIGGKNVIETNGSNGKCVVNKYKIWNLGL